MEAVIDLNSEIEFQKFWSRRISGAHAENETTAEYLLEHQEVFPPAQVEVDDEEELLSKVAQNCAPCNKVFSEESVCECQPKGEELDASKLRDIPCSYQVRKLERHELPAVGVYVDPRIVPGFKYKIKTLSSPGERRERWLFGGESRELESIGRGYARRITLRPPKGCLNDNPDIFWTDSNDSGYSFQIEVISPGDKFTVLDASSIPVGQLELLENQGPQVEVGMRSCSSHEIEKTVRVRALCKVEWFHEEDSPTVLPLNGLAISVRRKEGVVTKVKDVRLGWHQRRGFTLIPGICSSLRSIHLSSKPLTTSYTIVGLEPHQLPVIGSYVDDRIVSGFYYRVYRAGGKPLWNGRSLRLDSIGRGYTNRLTFAPDRLNEPENHFWSDSHAEGFGFEHSAVRPGMQFEVTSGNRVIGTATVFRDDCGPQCELSQNIEKTGCEISIVKRIQIDVKCEVKIDIVGNEKMIPHVMRVSGTAVLSKTPKQVEAKVVRIEDIGLDSHLNVLFIHQLEELTFIPIN